MLCGGDMRVRPAWRHPGGLVAVLCLLWVLAPLWRHARTPPAVLLDASTLADGGGFDALDASHTNVSFDTLASVHYREPVSTGHPLGIPAELQRLDRQPVSIDGFMLPIDLDGERVTRFILNANRDMCMFGAPSVAEQRVEVVMETGRAAAFTHRAMRVFGVLEIRPEYDGGSLSGLYRLRATAIGAPGLGY